MAVIAVSAIAAAIAAVMAIMGVNPIMTIMTQTCKKIIFVWEPDFHLKISGHFILNFF